MPKLHHRADAPGDEFLVAEALGASMPAGGGLQHQVEDLAADLLYGGFAIGDGAGVDVHIVGHSAVCIAVGGDLDDGDSRETDGASAARGKSDRVADAGSQS